MGPRHFCRGNCARGSSAGCGLFSFNGATAFLPWKYKWLDMQPHEFVNASMGPRHFCRGNLETGGLLGCGAAIASMGPRHFCRGNSVVLQSSDLEAAMLQWGHGISAVEIMSESLHGSFRW